jgi:hypothetical protein
MAADFLITSISSMPIPKSESVMYTLSGELNVPMFYGNFCKAFRNMTSIQALQKVASELQLGFADNQPEGTADTMTWIMPNYTYHSFMKSIAKLAYVDDNNFFDFFIDRYYILNFINVEKQFSKDKEIDTGFLALDQLQIDKSRSDPEKDKEVEIEIPLVITNHPDSAQTELYISDFAMVSNHGEIIRQNTLRKYLYWYDHGTNSEPENKTDDANYRCQFIEPLMSTTENDGKIPQTVSIEEYQKLVTDGTTSAPKVASSEWSGMQYGNAHSEYKYAELLNYHNWLETEKNMLNVTLMGFNVNILRGSRIKVDIYLDRQAAAAANVMADDGDTSIVKNKLESGDAYADGKGAGVVLDKALSDFYYVSSMDYVYRGGKFETSLSLSRRHWLKQPENKVNV